MVFDFDEIEIHFRGTCEVCLYENLSNDGPVCDNCIPNPKCSECREELRECDKSKICNDCLMDPSS